MFPLGFLYVSYLYFLFYIDIVGTILGSLVWWLLLGFVVGFILMEAGKQDPGWCTVHWWPANFCSWAARARLYADLRPAIVSLVIGQKEKHNPDRQADGRRWGKGREGVGGNGLDVWLSVFQSRWRENFIKCCYSPIVRHREPIYIAISCGRSCRRRPAGGAESASINSDPTVNWPTVEMSNWDFLGGTFLPPLLIDFFFWNWLIDSFVISFLEVLNLTRKKVRGGWKWRPFCPSDTW